MTPEAEADFGWHLLGGEATDEVVVALRRGANGNPLFLEERFASLVETGSLVQSPGGWSLSDVARAEVPQVLERLVRSRLDMLRPTAREVARTASVLR